MQQLHVIQQLKATRQTGFILLCSLVFAAALAITLYFSIFMCCDMKMPGGWRMSMMWMRMAGDTWFTGLLHFMLMWLAMMIVMMLPSALPMFLKTQQQYGLLLHTALGYFSVWLAAGVAVYMAGVALANVTMQSMWLSSSFPFISGAVLVAAGLYQFSNIKMKSLLHCRSPLGCAVFSLQKNKGFKLGYRQGFICCTCCGGLMLVQIVLGIMNPVLMLVIASAISAEKLLPAPVVIVKIVGVIAIVASCVVI